jgi:hypothetical protein
VERLDAFLALGTPPLGRAAERVTDPLADFPAHLPDVALNQSHDDGTPVTELIDSLGRSTNLTDADLRK